MSIIEKALDIIDQEQRTKATVRLQGYEQAAAIDESDLDQDFVHPEDLHRTESAELGDTAELGRAKTSQHFDLDLAKLKQMGILVPGHSNKQLAEEYRHIKRPLLMVAFGDIGPVTSNRNLVMVTSAVPGEGKTFTSTNLAMSVATEINRTVLLVDADAPMHTLSTNMGIANRPGMMDYVRDQQTDLADHILSTNVADLRLLPSGPNYEHVTELWASDRMQQVLGQLSRRYADRLVIFDSPPLLAEASGSVLARTVGQVIVVIEAEKTPQHVVREALQTISDCDNVGIVLNKSNQRTRSEYYYNYR